MTQTHYSPVMMPRFMSYFGPDWIGMQHQGDYDMHDEREIKAWLESVRGRFQRATVDGEVLIERAK